MTDEWQVRGLACSAAAAGIPERLSQNNGPGVSQNAGTEAIAAVGTDRRIDGAGHRSGLRGSSVLRRRIQIP